MKNIRLGMLTPSSNTALEPLCAAMLAGLPEVSAHFARFRVTEIALHDRALGQFDLEPILQAASLLADARVDVICWNGTAAGWLGFDADVALCRAITERTGVPACTSVLALNQLMTRHQRRRFGLVTPYLSEVQARIVANYAANGYAVLAERHLGHHVNYEFAEVEPDTVAGLVRDVALSRPDCITTFCTNLRAAQLAATLEAELGIPLYDTVATAVWASLRLAGVDPARVVGWGRLFQEGT